MMIAFRSFVPSIDDDRDAVIAGWFGPIGIVVLSDTTVAHRDQEDGSDFPSLV